MPIVIEAASAWSKLIFKQFHMAPGLRRRTHMTTRAFKLSRLALAATAGMVCLSINDNLSSSQQSGLIMQADARVGRPLTAGSVAGVARRTGRRAYCRGAMVG